MKFCADCGGKIDAASEVCPLCGVRQVMKKGGNKALVIVLIVVATGGLLFLLSVLGVFWGISGEEKTKKLPKDSNHLRFHDLMKSGKSKIDIDPLCAECHDGNRVKFPVKHPGKPTTGPMRCLFCHKV